MEAQQSDNITIDISDETLATTHAYVFNTDANITATFNSIERVIASGNGDDTINVNGDRNTTLAVGEDGQLIITNGDNATQAENVAFIELDDDTVAIADNEADALTLKLYQGVLGRSAAAGADYWPDLEPQTDVEIAARFLDSAEFAKEHRPDEDLSNEQLIDILYENALGRDPDDAGRAYQLDAHAEVTVNIIGSEEAAESIDSFFLLGGQA